MAIFESLTLPETTNAFSNHASQGVKGSPQIRAVSGNGNGQKGSSPRYHSSGYSEKGRLSAAGAHEPSTTVIRGRGSSRARNAVFTNPTAPKGSGNQAWRKAGHEDPATYKKRIADLYTVLKENRERERKQAIKDGFLADPDRPTSLANAITPVGTCQSMCPEFERVERIVQMMVDGAEKESISESVKVASEDLMVKRFRRSAAGYDEQLPSDIRPPSMLKTTLDYLLHDVVGASDSLSSIHKFVWDRTRGIRNDFSIQQVSKREDLKIAIECFERIARFHILSLHQLSHSDAVGHEFDQHQEKEQLNNTLLSLMYYYDDSRSVLESPNEAEFRAYCIIFEIQDQRPDLEDRIQTWPRAILQSSKVQIALKIYNAAITTVDEQGPLRPRIPFTVAQQAPGNFWNILRSSAVSYLSACVAEVYFNAVRHTALGSIWQACKGKRAGSAKVADWTLQDMTIALGFDNDSETQQFCEDHGLSTVKSHGGDVCIDLGSASAGYLTDTNTHRRQSFSATLVESKRYGRSLHAIMDGLTVSQAREQEDIDRRINVRTSAAQADQKPVEPSSTLQFQPTFQKGDPAPSFSNVANPFSAVASPASMPTPARSDLNKPASSPFEIKTNAAPNKIFQSPSNPFQNMSNSSVVQEPLPAFKPPPPISSPAVPTLSASNSFGPQSGQRPSAFSAFSKSPITSLSALKDATPSPFSKPQTFPTNSPAANNASFFTNSSSTPTKSTENHTFSVNADASAKPSPFQQAQITATNHLAAAVEQVSATTRANLGNSSPKQSVSHSPMGTTSDNVSGRTEPLSKAVTFSPRSSQLASPANNTSTSPSQDGSSLKPMSANEGKTDHSPPETKSISKDERMHERKSKAEADSLHRKAVLKHVAQLLLTEPQGLLQQYVEHALVPILRSAISQVEDEKSWARAAQCRIHILSHKYFRRWQAIAWNISLKRRARDRRKLLHASLRRQSGSPSTCSNTSTIDGPAQSQRFANENTVDGFGISMAPEPDISFAEFERQLATSTSEKHIGHKRKRQDTIQSSPIPRLSHRIARKRSSFAALPSNHSGRASPKAPLKKISWDHRRVGDGSILGNILQQQQEQQQQQQQQHRQRQQMVRARSIATTPDNTKTAYFRLKAFGLDPDSPTGLETRESSPMAKEADMALKASQLPAINGQSPGDQVKSDHPDRGRAQSRAQIENVIKSNSRQGSGQGSGQGRKEEQEQEQELLDSIRSIRESMAETTSWFQRERLALEDSQGQHPTDLQKEQHSHPMTQSNPDGHQNRTITTGDSSSAIPQSRDHVSSDDKNTINHHLGRLSSLPPSSSSPSSSSSPLISLRDKLIQRVAQIEDRRIEAERKDKITQDPLSLSIYPTDAHLVD